MISVAIITQSLTFLRNVPRGFDRKEQKDRADTKRYRLYLGALEGIRTPDLLVRSQSLYPAELTAHFKMLNNDSTNKIKNQE